MPERLGYNRRVWKTVQSKREMRNSVARVLFAVVVLLAVALGGFWVGRAQSPATLDAKDRESVALYAEALDVVRNNYVDQEDIDSKKETYGAIKGCSRRWAMTGTRAF